VTAEQARVASVHPLLGRDARVELDPDDSSAWREFARCRGLSPSLFFPSEEDGEDVAEAQRICAECPVRAQCLERALAGREQYGVWGGTTPRDRRRLLRHRRRTA
jgi:WhiB family redox-sensing transcriptional regulator